MEHGFTWYYLLPHELQALLPEHTFFALIAALLVFVFALRARELARAEDPTVPEEKLGARNLPSCCLSTLSYVKATPSSEKLGASMCLILRVFSSSFFLAI